MRRTKKQALVAAAALVAVGAAGASTAAATGTSHEPDRKAKNIILLVGDGMGVTHVDAARIRYYGAAGRLHMERSEYRGSVKTYAVEEKSDKPDYVTDSASSGTAWSSGVKTYNAAIGVDAYGKVVPTIMEQAKAAGMRTGNVSTAEITDATPAAMFSHVGQRGCQGPDLAPPCAPGETPIAEQIARNNVADVVLGGGLSRFEPDDEAVLRRNGYAVLGSFGAAGLAEQTEESQRVPTQADLAAVGGRDRRVIGLFNRGNLTVETAKAARPDAVQAKEPSLPEMTSKAIQLLSESRQGQQKGFFLQVEGALIDKRSHANDAGQTLGETKAFDDAVAVAMDYAAKRDDTLVITTADHECAGFAIVAQDSFTNAEAAAPPGNVDTGNPANNSRPTRESRANVVGPERSTGAVNGAGANDPRNFAPATFRTADDPPGVADGSPEASLWLSYLSGNHTGEDVNIYASGPSSYWFSRLIDNTEIYHLMKTALVALG